MPEPSQDDLQRLADWVRHNFGISFPDVAAPAFVMRVVQFCTQHKTTVPEALERCKRGERAFVQSLAEALSTNYTFFFREQIVLDYFASTIAPTLPPMGARLWSAACSSGEEVYTLAAILAQTRQETSGDSFAILGTDISQRHIRVGEAAIYPAPAVTASCPPDVVRQFFTPVSLGMYRVSETLRRSCTFRLLNLRAAPWPFERKFHTIFIRNVLYYFDGAEGDRIGLACAELLEPGGWLVTSVTDPVLHLEARGVRLVRPGIYRRYT